MEQIDRLRKALPRYGFATDAFEHGLRYYTQAEMIRFLYVQMNARNSVASMVYDLDSETASTDWIDSSAPVPNILIVNPANGHAHAVYQLETPVHKNPRSSERALRYLASIDVALTDKLCADPNYGKLIAKNPIRGDHWKVFWIRQDPYTLDQIAQYLDLEPFRDQRRRLPNIGYGRNCTLFETLRIWAYRERRKPQQYLSFELFRSTVLSRGLAINAGFYPPLPHSEVRATARSIARWTWRNMSEAGFREWGNKRRRKAAAKRKADARQRHELIRQTVEQCPELSQADIAMLCGVTRETVNRALRNAADPPEGNSI